ncbi:RNA polymerase sigma factor [Parapedobacter tibetensis]|uniref:RNA polymerase sigma factor n=1 Tax=Parapedobacter tibetensis TaxID=2972951 RepID=UPI00214D383C|nr:RNA polymerase sigma-70 factor [Parapedobacter tibetensis]
MPHINLKMQAISNDVDEKELLQRFRRGDYAAFDQLYDTYKRPLAKVLLRFLKSSELADEALQDLFMKLWENKSKIDPEKSIKAYLFRMAENLVVDFFRRAARDKQMRAHFMVTSTEIYSHIEAGLFSKERKEQLYRAIDQLSPQRRKVFVLCKLESKSYEEVSQLLKISVSAVNDHIKKSNLFLKKYFNTQSFITTMLFVISLLN